VVAGIFYKDSSLVWRCASHYVASDNDQWIGKGAVKPVDGDDELYASAEETTNLPFELQAALDDLSRRGGRARPDHRAIALVLRRGPDGRVEPYADFTRPRDRAIENGEFNDGHPVAWFDHPLRPASLRFASGYAPAATCTAVTSPSTESSRATVRFSIVLLPVRGTSGSCHHKR